ncbi:MAG: tandem-95 repeat protein [Nitrosopumilus sp.]|nr:tandem-95 repeat protein [Nitrosopumilus sp.]
MEDLPINIILTGSDPEGDPLTFTIAQQPSDGTLLPDPPTPLGPTSAMVTYTPDQFFDGLDDFVFRVSDGITTDTAKVFVTVTPFSNSPPSAAPDSFEVAEDSSIQFLNLTKNDSDPDTPLFGDVVTVFSIDTSQTIGATITISADSKGVDFTPDLDFDGTASFTYIATDGMAQSAIANVAVTVTGSPDQPIAVTDTASVAVNSSPVNIKVLINDIDVDTGDVLSVTAIDDTGTDGIVTLVNSTDVSFQPDLDFEGMTSFGYTVTDSFGLDANGTVNVNVNSLEGLALFVTSASFTNKIIMYDAASATLIGDFIGSGVGGLNLPYNIKFASDGDVYVSSLNTNSILHYHGNSGDFIETVIDSGDGLSTPSK